MFGKPNDSEFAHVLLKIDRGGDGCHKVEKNQALLCLDIYSVGDCIKL